MPTPKEITLANFSKGLVTDRPDVSLDAGEFSELDNWYLQAGKMRTRPPIEIFPLRTGSTWGFGNVKGLQMVGDQAILIRTGALSTFNSTSGQCADLTSAVLTFLPLGQTARPWTGMCAAPNGNIYACENNGDIYMQTAGAGNFVALSQTARQWYSMCATPGGNVYAAVYNGDIYMQTAGAGAFVALGGTVRNWQGMCAAPNGNVYACHGITNGDIYMQTGGAGAFVALAGTLRHWQGMCAAPNGDIYACVDAGDIYVQTGGVGAFVALGGTSRAWRGMTADSSGNIYAAVNAGGIYKRVAGAGAFISTGQTSRLWWGMCCNSSNILYAAVVSGDIYNTAVSFPTGDKPQSVQYNGFGYAAIGNGILKFNSANYWALGVAPPPTAPTIVDGVAGTVEAGVMYGIYTFVDADGKESGPSPVSASLTHTVNFKVAWSGVAVALDARVVARNLYRTLPNQTGEYFYVGQIADNTSTTVSEDTVIASMGDLADINRGRYEDFSDGNAYDLATVFERLWATDGLLVYGSLPEDPEYFDAENVYAFSPDDGESITALEALPGMLIVLKEGSVWALDQSLGFFEFLPRLVDNSAGCAFTQSAASSGKLVFFASKNAVFMCDGRSPAVDISTGRIDLKNKLGAGAVGCVFRKRGWYVLYSVGEGGDSAIRVFDYIRNYWFTVSYGKTITGGGNTAAASAPEFFAEGLNSAGSPTIYTVMNSTTSDRGTLTDLFDEEAVGGSGVADEGVGDAVNAVAAAASYTISDAKISSTAQFRALDWGAPGLLHTISRILISCTDPVESVTYTDANAQLLSTVSVIREDGRVAAKSRSSVDISGTRQWKNVGLSSRDRKCTQSAIKIVRNSRWPLVIEGLKIYGELWDQIPVE